MLGAGTDVEVDAFLDVADVEVIAFVDVDVNTDELPPQAPE